MLSKAQNEQPILGNEESIPLRWLSDACSSSLGTPIPSIVYHEFITTPTFFQFCFFFFAVDSSHLVSHRCFISVSGFPRSLKGLANTLILVSFSKGP